LGTLRPLPAKELRAALPAPLATGPHRALEHHARPTTKLRTLGSLELRALGAVELRTTLSTAEPRTHRGLKIHARLTAKLRTLRTVELRSALPAAEPGTHRGLKIHAGLTAELRTLGSLELRPTLSTLSTGLRPLRTMELRAGLPAKLRPLRPLGTTELFTGLATEMRTPRTLEFAAELRARGLRAARFRATHLRVGHFATEAGAALKLRAAAGHFTAPARHELAGLIIVTLRAVATRRAIRAAGAVPVPPAAFASRAFLIGPATFAASGIWAGPLGPRAVGLRIHSVSTTPRGGAGAIACALTARATITGPGTGLEFIRPDFAVSVAVQGVEAGRGFVDFIRIKHAVVIGVEELKKAGHGPLQRTLWASAISLGTPGSIRATIRFRTPGDIRTAIPLGTRSGFRAAIRVGTAGLPRATLGGGARARGRSRWRRWWSDRRSVLRGQRPRGKHHRKEGAESVFGFHRRVGLSAPIGARVQKIERRPRRFCAKIAALSQTSHP
jgi:hypothetical protein